MPEYSYETLDELRDAAGRAQREIKEKHGGSSSAWLRETFSIDAVELARLAHEAASKPPDPWDSVVAFNIGLFIGREASGKPSPSPATFNVLVDELGVVFEGLTYDEMRECVLDIHREWWQEAGAPIDPAWPTAPADEVAWKVLEDGKRQVPVPDDVHTLIVEEIFDA